MVDKYMYFCLSKQRKTNVPLLMHLFTNTLITLETLIMKCLDIDVSCRLHVLMCMFLIASTLKANENDR